MRYIGLDLGTKTLGISISNGIIANNYTTLRHDEDYDYLVNEVDKKYNRSNSAVPGQNKYGNYYKNNNYKFFSNNNKTNL